MKKMVGMLVLLLVAGWTLAQQGTVIADGFNGPMGVLAAPDGSIWVVDSGLGGELSMEMFNPEAGEMTMVSIGDSSRVVRVAPDGSQAVMATLPSLAMGQETVGGARLALLNGEVYATSGVWVEFSGPDALPLMGSVVRLHPGGVSEVANAWVFENLANPDRFIRESHPYGLLAGPDGMLWVADAGANTVYKVDPMTSSIELVAVLDGLPGPFPNPARGDRMESDPVPTGITLGADGNVYIATLPGFPFAPGSSSVMRLGADGSLEMYAGGLTMTTDLQAGPDGELYAVQFAVWGEQGPQPGSGALVRVGMGTVSPVIEGLVFPTSVSFDADGNAYVTTNGVGAPGSGQVVRFDGVAAP